MEKKMKETKIKETILSNEAMELNDAELENAAGGSSAPGGNRDLGIKPDKGMSKEELIKMCKKANEGVLSGDQGIPEPPLMPEIPGGNQNWNHIAPENPETLEQIKQRMREMGY